MKNCRPTPDVPPSRGLSLPGSEFTVTWDQGLSPDCQVGRRLSSRLTKDILAVALLSADASPAERSDYHAIAQDGHLGTLMQECIRDRRSGLDVAFL